MKHIKTFNSINELRRTSLSGTMAGSIESLEDKKYELKKDVKGAKIGDFINVVLPKGTIIHNLPGGVFADHSSLKNKYTGKSSQGPEWFDKPTFKGVMIKQMPDTLAAIEKNSKVLESAINEGSRWDFSKAEIKKAAETLAKAMAKADKVKVEVHDFEYDKGRGAGFELSYDGDKYDGGSYYIKPNGDVINAAIKGGTKYGNVKSSEKDYLKYFKANESVTEGTYNSKDHIGSTADGQGSNAEIYKKGKGYYVVVSGEADYDFDAKNDKELLKKLKDNEFDSTDILEVNESSSKDGGDKSNGNSHHEDHKEKSIAQHWKDTYGEEFSSKYPAIGKMLKQRPGMDKRELKRIWDETYGENFEEQYPALYNKLD